MTSPSDADFADAGYGYGENDDLAAESPSRVMFIRTQSSIGPTPSNVFEVEITTTEGLVELTVPAEWLRVRSWSRVRADSEAWGAQKELDVAVADLEAQFNADDEA